MDLFDLFLKILVLSFFIGIYLGIPYLIYQSIKQNKHFKTFILIFVYFCIIFFHGVLLTLAKGLLWQKFRLNLQTQTTLTIRALLQLC